MTRLFITENITRESEEDLERLLLSVDKRAELFNYSPFILRIVNELLLEQGYSVGLGYKSTRAIIDNYWKGIRLPIQSDVVIRIIDHVNIDYFWGIVVLLRDRVVHNKMWDDLYSITKLKPKNDLIFRGIFSNFEESSLNSIVEQIKSIVDKNSLSYKIEKYVISKKTTTVENKVVDLYLPPDASFSCKMCSMCELPSNYSINPIPNKSTQHFQSLFTCQRIGFPSNLACLSLYEAIEISTKRQERLEKFCKPVIFSKNKEGVIVDYQLALNQNNGLCIFFDKDKGLCKIHEYKPLNCFSYPFLITKINDTQISIELDFSCPGLFKGKTDNLSSFLENIYFRLLQGDNSMIEFNNVYSLKWDLSSYFDDYERVKKEDIEETLDYLYQKYSQFIEK